MSEQRTVYLDNSATTAVDIRVADAVYDAMRKIYGNPSSLHSLGVAAEQAVERARAELLAAMGAKSGTIVFTGGGTESNNLAVLGAAEAKKRRGSHIIASAYEHPSVDEPLRILEKHGFSVTRISPGPDGAIHPETVAEKVGRGTVLVSVMTVNNETGAVNDIAALARLVKRANPETIIHTDAVQALGKIPMNGVMGADLISVSGHKIHAPKGIGALYMAKSPGVRILPILHGGGQENGLRSGTEPVPNIVGFGLAARIAAERLEQNRAVAERLRARLLDAVLALEGIDVNSTDPGVPYIVNLSVRAVRSEIMLHFLEQRGIFVSSGSACSKGAKSRTLSALSLPDARIDTALRISFCGENTESDVDELVSALDEGMKTLIKSR